MASGLAAHDISTDPRLSPVTCKFIKKIELLKEHDKLLFRLLLFHGTRLRQYKTYLATLSTRILGG